MKGFIACVLAMVPAFVSARLHTPIHVALTFDEEIGCVGVRRLLDVLAPMPVRPRMGIVGEPTSMRVVCEHKGKQALRVCIRGREAHSSRPTAGVNAVAYAAQLMAFIGELAAQKQRNGPFDPLYEVPYTTLHVGTVRGGSALNVVPAECSFDFEIRHLPGEAPGALLERICRHADEVLLPAMRAVAPEASIDFTPLSSYPGLQVDAEAEAVRFVQSLLDDRAPPGKIAFGTEAGLFHARCGVPTVVCGPGDIAQAHQPDEFVEIEQLQRCLGFLARLRDALSAARSAGG
jgi:acetylornithine deacetylase